MYVQRAKSPFSSPAYHNWSSRVKISAHTLSRFTSMPVHVDTWVTSRVSLFDWILSLLTHFTSLLHTCWPTSKQTQPYTFAHPQMHFMFAQLPKYHYTFFPTWCTCSEWGPPTSAVGIQRSQPEQVTSMWEMACVSFGKTAPQLNQVSSIYMNDLAYFGMRCFIASCCYLYRHGTKGVVWIF